MGMSILPKWHNGRVCIPWWYGLGYPLVWCFIGFSMGITIGSDNMIAITTASAIALVVSAFVGAILYTAFASISAYQEQKAQAVELKAKIVTSGRDPEDPACLTVKEKWDIQKVAKFNKLFIIADVLQVIVGTIIAVSVLYFFGGDYIADAWEQYAVAGFIAGIVGAWFIGETLVKTAVAGEWSKKAAEAFRGVKAVAEDAIKGMTRKDELVARFIEEGFSKKEAQNLAKEILVDEMKKE